MILIMYNPHTIYIFFTSKDKIIHKYDIFYLLILTISTWGLFKTNIKILVLCINNKYPEELSYIYWIFLNFYLCRKNNANK